MIYPAEQFTVDEQERLRPYFSNLDRPVFALMNLPETVKAALFARYSRYQGTLRRLFLDEFADSLPSHPGDWSGREGERAAALFERVFVGFGDDSVAQLGGAHLACEWCSNVLTKLIQRPRLASYLEQSTRYIPYNSPVDRLGFRYYRDESLGPEYVRAMDELFRIYGSGLEVIQSDLANRFPRSGEQSEAAHSRALRAKALDLLRGLLPAGSLSHVGIFASGQAYEQLLLHLLASPLAEAREYGQMMHEELLSVIPSFLARVERPDRGGRWIEYLNARHRQGELLAHELGLDEEAGEEGPSVRLLRVEGSEEQLLAGLLFENSSLSEETIAAKVATLDHREQGELFSALVGERENRRHKPGRGFERISYLFEIVSDYGAFRDLQRHRLLTCQWQWPTATLGADVPYEVEEAGYGGEYRRALEISQKEYERLSSAGHGLAASYAVCLAFRMRYTLDMNAREAMHLIELRSGQQGHPSYRAVAQEMHRLISLHHPLVGAAMSHVDRSTEPRLERLLAELRNEARQQR